MYGHPYFVRVGSGGGENWLTEKHPPPEKLGLDDLKVKGIVVSTYLVGSDAEEALAVGAHTLTKTKVKAEACFALRIRFSDIREAGVGVCDGHLGQTGVVCVDYSHRDLVSDQPKITLLAEIILRKIREGQDRVRKLSAYQVKLSLRKIMDLGLQERPSFTAEQCESALGITTQCHGAGTIEPRNRREQTCLELSKIRIPDHVTRCRAYQIYENRRPDHRTSEQDWLEALASLRAEYREHYLKTWFVD